MVPRVEGGKQNRLRRSGVTVISLEAKSVSARSLFSYHSPLASSPLRLLQPHARVNTRISQTFSLPTLAPRYPYPYPCLFFPFRLDSTSLLLSRSTTIYTAISHGHLTPVHASRGLIQNHFLLCGLCTKTCVVNMLRIPHGPL